MEIEKPRQSKLKGTNKIIPFIASVMIPGPYDKSINSHSNVWLLITLLSVYIPGLNRTKHTSHPTTTFHNWRAADSVHGYHL